MISALVVDDEALVRRGIRMILDAAADIEVVGEAGGGREALALVARVRPDVVLMDVRMADMDGVEATRRILQVPGTATRVLMLTTFDADQHLYDAVRAGASGFLLKSSPPEQLTHAVRVVAEGDTLLAPALTRRLLDRFTAQPLPGGLSDRRLDPLTAREREVLTLVGQTLSNAEIAEALVLSEGTVKTHLGRIFTKLALRDRAHAVALAYDTGLVTPTAPPGRAAGHRDPPDPARPRPRG